MRHTSKLRLVLALFLLALGACEARVSLGGRCVSDSECVGLRCLYGRCRAECLTGGDCGGALECNAGVCAQPDEACSDTDPCASPELACAGSICATRCAADGTCAGDARCDDTFTVPVCVPPSATDAGPRDASSDAGSMDAGITPAGGQICVGEFHACAVRGPSRRVYCWGANNHGQLGDTDLYPEMRLHEAACGHDVGDTGDCATRPGRAVRVYDGARITGPLEDVEEIACGASAICARNAGGDVFCWGSQGIGRVLGHPGIGYAAERAFRGAVRGPFMGRAHTCVIDGAGAPWCWGESSTPELGIDDRTGTGASAPTVDAPARATDLDGSRELGLGGLFSCALDAAGEARCLGVDEAHVTGGPVGVRTDPSPILTATGPLRGASAITAGWVHACVIVGEEVLCWGGHALGELAVPQTSELECGDSDVAFFCRGIAAPVNNSIGVRARALSHGTAQTSCVVGADGEAVCWGSNSSGQAGLEPVIGNERALALTSAISTEGGSRLTGVAEIAVGGETACARTSADEVYCWGRASFGQRGDGSVDWDPHPRARRVDFSGIEP